MLSTEYLDTALALSTTLFSFLFSVLLNRYSARLTPPNAPTPVNNETATSLCKNSKIA